MPTAKQTLTQIKKEQADIKRGIIDQVTCAVMHILYDSHLYGTILWPKNGVVACGNEGFEKGDIIMVRAIVRGNENRLLLNMVNKSHKRVREQAKIIEPILDQAIYDNVFLHFTHYGDCGLSGTKTFGQMDFNFTIQQQ